MLKGGNQVVLAMPRGFKMRSSHACSKEGDFRMRSATTLPSKPKPKLEYDGRVSGGNIKCTFCNLASISSVV